MIAITLEPVSHTYTVVENFTRQGVTQTHHPDVSVTGTLRAVGYLNFDGIPGDVLEAARARGRRVHRAAHFLTEGSLDWASVDDADKGYVESCADLLLVGEYDTVSQELGLWHPEWKYVGTADLLAIWQGAVSILDWKTGPLGLIAADLQTAAYAEALRVLIARGEGPPELIDATPGDVILRASVELFENGRRGQLHPYRNPYDWNEFQAALITARGVARRRRLPREYAA